jgi:hypothetical protein
LTKPSMGRPMTFSKLLAYVSVGAAVVSAIAGITALFLPTDRTTIAASATTGGTAAAGSVTGATNSITSGHGSQITVTASGNSAEEIEQRRRQNLVSQYFAAWRFSNDGITSDEMAGIPSPRVVDYVNGRLEQAGRNVAVVTEGLIASTMLSKRTTERCDVGR